jgi:hypothetical protein
MAAIAATRMLCFRVILDPHCFERIVV